MQYFEVMVNTQCSGVLKCSRDVPELWHVHTQMSVSFALDILRRFSTQQQSTMSTTSAGETAWESAVAVVTACKLLLHSPFD